MAGAQRRGFARGALRQLQPSLACALRGGEWLNALPASELVPGDIVYAARRARPRSLSLLVARASRARASLTAGRRHLSLFLSPDFSRYLRVGDKVPCDARLVALKTTSFSTEESSLTARASRSRRTRGRSTTRTPSSPTSATVFAGTMVTAARRSRS